MNNKKVISWILLLSMAAAVIILSWQQPVIKAAGTVEQVSAPSDAGFPQPYLVKDINTTTPSSDIYCPVVMDAYMLCSAADGDHGWELWRSDGTENGASLVKDLVPGTESSRALRIGPAYARINDELFFGFHNQDNVGALWKTDGSTTGTTVVKDGFFPNFERQEPEFVALGDLLIFVARMGDYGEELWRSDGTEDGTIMLTDNGTTISNGFRNFIPMGDKVYFINDRELTLWASDGTRSGTSQLVDSDNPEMIGGVVEMVAFNDKLILKKVVPGSRPLLWLSDGSSAEPMLISDLGGEDGPQVTDLVALDNKVLFTHYRGGNAKTWGVGTTDGTPEGTAFFDIVSEHLGGGGLIAAGSQAFFKQSMHPENTTVLWRSDGTAAGTYPLKAFEQFDGYDFCSANFYVVGSAIYFAAYDSEHGCELWRSDGTVAGTNILSDIVPGEISSNPEPGVFFNGYLYFSATDRLGDRELWRTDGSAIGTVLADDVLNSPTYSSSPDKLVAHPSGIYFAARQGTHSRYDDWGLWESDGTEAGTSLIKSFGYSRSDVYYEGTVFGSWQDWVTVGDIVYFKAIDRDTWRTFNLWRSDGTESGTTIINGPPECADHGIQDAVDNTLYFISDGWLCKADYESSTISSLEYQDSSTGLVAGESLLFFQSGNRIGISDGSPAGTRQFAEPVVLPWYMHPYFSNAAVLGSTLLFSGCNETWERNCELWRLRGADTEPELLRELYPGNVSSDPSYFAVGEGVAYFGAVVGRTDGYDSVLIYELWRSDGSDEGTSSIAEVSLCGQGAFSAGRLVFPAKDKHGYCEVWISDGTEAGTHILKDIVPDYGASDPRQFTAAMGYVFFTADDGVHGRELFVTDGTEAGTFMVADLVPGAASSEPSGVTVAGNKLFFAASSLAGEIPSTQQDRELWAVDLTKLPVAARFSVEPTSGPPGLVFDFRNRSIGNFEQCTWDFGDGEVVNSCDDQTYGYGGSGLFTVSLTVTGPGGNNTMTKTDYITVYEPPIADFGASRAAGAPPLAVEFTNLSTGDFDECLWDFGDGSSSESCDDPSHTYSSAGSFTVTLAVDGPGGHDVLTMADYITVYEPAIADFTAFPACGIAPLEVNFTNLSTGDFDQCLWDFGDGSSSESCDDPSHTYSSGGSFTVSLAVDGPGGIDQLTMADFITIYEPPKADFTALPTSGIAPLDVEFTNLSTGDFDQCLWDFGDGSTSDSCDDPAHNYSGSGAFAVTLTVEGLGGSNTISKMEHIVVFEPVKANFIASPENGAPPLAVAFTNLSTGDFDQCLWDFGDDTTSDSCGDPTHNYNKEGHFTVSLEVKGMGGDDTMAVEKCVDVSYYRLFLPTMLR